MIDFKYRTFWPRVGAAFIDGIVIFIPLAFLNYLIWLNFLEIPSGLLFIWFIFSSFAYLIYSVLMHGFFGQTLGKMNFKVKVLDISENKLTMRQAFLRDIIPIILTTAAVIHEAPNVIKKVNLYGLDQKSIFMVILSYINYAWVLAEVVTMLTNSKRRALHDFIAKSVVIKYGKVGKYIASEKEIIFVLILLMMIIFAVILLFVYFLIFAK